MFSMYFSKRDIVSIFYVERITLLNNQDNSYFHSSHSLLIAASLPSPPNYLTGCFIKAVFRLQSVEERVESTQ